MDRLLGNQWINLGLGILAANKPGASAGEAIGQGGLLGMENLRRNQEAQELQRLRQAQAHAAQQRQALAEQKWRTEKDRIRRQAKFRAEIEQRAASGNPMSLEEMAQRQAAFTGSYAPMLDVAEMERGSMNRMNEATYRHELASRLASQRASQSRALAQHKHSLGGAEGQRYNRLDEIQITPEGMRPVWADPRTGARVYADTGEPVDYSKGTPLPAPIMEGKLGTDAFLAAQAQRAPLQKVSPQAAHPPEDETFRITPKDVEQGTGPGAAFGQAFQKYAGWAVPGRHFTEQVDAKQKMEFLANEARGVFTKGDRHAVWDQKEAMKLVPDSKQVFADPEDERARYRKLRRYTKSMLSRVNSGLQKPVGSITPEKRRSYQDQKGKLERLLLFMGEDEALQYDPDKAWGK